METFFVNNKKVIIAVAGAAAGATLLIWLHQRTKETSQVKKQSDSEEKKISPVPPVSEEKISPVPKQEQPKEDEVEYEYLSYSLGSPEYQVKIQLRPGQDLSLSKEVKELIAKQVETESEHGHLTFMSMSSLRSAVEQFSFPTFYVLLKQFRQKRRSVQGFDEERYIAAQTEFVKGLKDIVRKSTLEVLAAINVSEADYEESYQYFGQFNLDYFVDTTRREWLKAFDSMEGKKLNPDQLVEILNTQTQLYNDEKENIQKLKEKYTNLSHADARELIQSKIDDQIYQKYNVEPENYAKIDYFNMSESGQKAYDNNYNARENFIQ